MDEVCKKLKATNYYGRISTTKQQLVCYNKAEESLVSDLNLNGADVGMFHKILSESNSDDTNALFKFMSIVLKQ